MPEIAKIRIEDPRAVGAVRVSYPANEVRTVRVSDLVSTTSGGGSGSVTSVGLSTTVSGLSVSGSPVTSSGTLALSGTVSAVTEAAVTAHQSAITIALSQVTDAGGAAALNVGTTAGTVAAGNDSRLSDARTPTAHASSHVGAGSDAIREATASQNGLMSSAYAAQLDAIASTYQPLDAQLTSLAGLSYTGNSLKVVRVNSGETGFELATISTGGVTSVAISGTDGIEVDSGSPITSSGTITLGVNVGTLKAHLSIASVEDVAISTWAGSANIETVGTITNGTWAGTAIADAYVAGASKWDAKISDISGFNVGDLADVTTSGTTDGHILQNVSGVFTSVSLATAGIQPLDTQLTDLAGLDYGGNGGKFVRVNAGETGFELATVSGSGTVTSVAISGSDGIEIDSGSPITTSGTIALGINASTLKTHLSLGNVENTALSTWSGSSNITTLGTVSTGTWSATAIAVNKGGTGATDASTARTNLGLAIGTNVQAYDAGLASLAGLSTTDKIYYLSAADTWSAVTIGSGLAFSSGTLSASGGGGSDTQWVTLDADLTLTGSTVGSTFQTIAWEGSETLSGEANSDYEFEWHGSVTTTGTGEGYSLQIVGPSDMTGEIRASLAPSATNPAFDVQRPSSGTAQFDQTTAIGATARIFRVEGLLRFVTGGGLTLKFKTEATSGSNTATLRQDSDARLTKIR